MRKHLLIVLALICALNSFGQFVKNKGQVVDLNQNFHPEVEYYSGVRNASVFFEKDRVVFNFREKDEFDFSEPRYQNNKDLRDSITATLGSTFHRIDLQLIGINENVKLQGESKASHTTNFFLNKRENIQNVSVFNNVRYNNVYPNIDLLFHFTSAGLKYDFILKEGANIEDIKFKYNGAKDVSIGENGKLNIETSVGSLKEDIPLSFLDKDKSKTTEVIYTMGEDKVIGFKLKKEASFSQLTIDPFITWGTYFEGSVGDNDLDYYSSIADDQGNYFVEGWINNAANDYPTVDPGGSAYFQNYVSNNLYIAKFNADRNLIWATYYGGSTSIDWSTATDPLAISGTTLHFVGSQLSSDAPLVNGGGYYYGAPNSDPYWLRLNKNTGQLLHATAFPSHTSSQPSVATSSSGLVAIIQQTYDFGNPEIVNRPGAYNQAVNGGYEDMHIMLFNSSNTLIWGTFLGGPNTTDNFHVTFDDNDNIFFVGEASNTFSPNATNTFLQSFPGSYYQSTYSAAMGNHDLIIGKFNASGALIWHTLYGGDASDGLKSQMGNGSRVIIDPDTQDLLVIGGTNSSNFPVQNLTGAYNQGTPPANTDPSGGSYTDFNSFIVKFNNDGARNWGTYWGDDPSGDLLYDAVFAGCDKFIVSSRSTDHTTIPLPYGYNQATGGQAFLMQFDGNFAAEWSSYIGDGGEPTIAHSSFDNRLYIGASTWSEALTMTDPGGGAYYDDTNDDPDVGTTSPAFSIYELDLNPQITGVNTACVGQTISLAGTGTAAAINPWVSSNTGIATVNSSGDVTGQSAGTATITYTDNAGCSATFSITINAGPTAAASAVSMTVCEGDDIELTGNTVGGATYSWTGPNGFTSSSEDPTINNAVTADAGTYSLVITSGGCSSGSSDVTISVNSNPTANAGVVSNTICSGDDINLTANTVGGATYSWTGPNGFTSSNEDPTISGASTAAGGTYSLTITNNGCTSATDNVNVTVNPTPTANAGATSTTICEGDDIELTANTVGGATYSWTGPNGFTSSVEDPTIIDATNSEAGTYTLIITQGSCSSISDNVSISVDPVPTAIAGVINTAICEGDNIELTGNTVSGATYSWTGPNGFTSSNEDPTINNATLTNDGTYSLVISIGSCSSINSDVDVTINELPSLSASGTDISCFGENDGEATVSATGNGPFDYSWSPSGGTAATASGLSEDMYTVTVTDNNSCVATETVTINEPTEIVLTTSTTSSQCTVDDGSATVSASGGSGNYTYLWTPSNQTTTTASGLGAGSYQIEVTDDSGCSVTGSVNVNSVNGPTVTVINVSDVTCPGGTDGSAEAEVTGGTSPYTYDWSPSGQTASIANNLDADDYTVEVTDDAGCIGLASVSINEPAPFDVSATINDAECGQSNGDIIVTASGANGNLTYSWAPVSGSTNSLLNVSGGTYTLTVTDDLMCAFDTSFVVNATGGLSVVTTPDTVTISSGDLVNISTNVDPNISGENYSWTPSNDLSCSDCADPVASPGQTTTYIVTVTTDDGCSETDTVQIFVDDPCGKVFVPNMFSPNGDSKNDELCVYGGCINSFEMYIYNRWGEIVYQSTDSEMCWNGSYKNEKLNTGVFVYKLIYIDSDGETQKQSGNIQLIR